MTSLISVLDNRSRAIPRACMWGIAIGCTIGCTPTPDGVGPNRLHLSFCSDPYGLEQRTLGIASVPQGTNKFITLNGERACSARQAETKQQQQQLMKSKKLFGS